MSFLKPAVILGAALALPPGQGAFAHGSGQQGGATVSASSQQPATQLTVTVDPDAPVAQVIQVARGAHVHLSVVGVGTNALHLHGYDIVVNAEPDQPAYVIFDAVHTGRFALEMHLDDDLLGRGEKAVLYIEVRAP